MQQLLRVIFLTSFLLLAIAGPLATIGARLLSCDCCGRFIPVGPGSGMIFLSGLVNKAIVIGLVLLTFAVVSEYHFRPKGKLKWIVLWAGLFVLVFYVYAVISCTDVSCCPEM